MKVRSVGSAAKGLRDQGIAGEKGMGCESPAKNCRCMYRTFLLPRAKARHWETEKTGGKNADKRLYGTSHKTCSCVFSPAEKRFCLFKRGGGL